MTTDLINELLGQMEEGTGIRKTLIGIRALTASGDDQALCNAARA